MPMINCPGCGKQLDSKTSKCPQCGYELQMMKLTKEQIDYVNRLRDSRLIWTDNYEQVMSGELPIPDKQDLIIWLLNDIKENTERTEKNTFFVKVSLIAFEVISALAAILIFLSLQ